MNVIDVLNRIEENGFEAYVVGGYVRDKILGNESSDIDICTNARVKELLDIFSDINITSNEYGSVKIVTNKLRMDITTYRKDMRYNEENRRDVQIEYVDNLLDDINRRDFTMNTLCMSKDGHIIDLLSGRDDIENKIIRCVGDANSRLKEDPLRMLRAVRFATVLDFSIEPNLYFELKNNCELINKLSRERVKEELTKILVSKNAVRGLDMLKELGMLEHIGISYGNVVYVSDICGMYSQLDIIKPLPFSKEEKENIAGIKRILEYGEIDKNILFEYGLYLSLVAGSILGVDKEYITGLESELKIKRNKDIKITSEEICDLLSVSPSKIIKEVYLTLRNLILDGELENDNTEIRNYIYFHRGDWLNE